MNKIVVATLGSWGDLHPFIALGHALRAAGAEPVLAVAQNDLEKCRAAGLDAHAILPPYQDSDKIVGLSEDEIIKMMGAEQSMIMEALLSAARIAIDPLRKIAADADAIVGSPFALAAPIVSELLDVPYIFAVLQPMTWFSFTDPPIAKGYFALARPPLGMIGGAWNRMVGTIITAEARRRFGKDINKVRAEVGLPETSSPPIIRPGSQPALSLGMYSPQFAPLPSDVDKPAHLSGFSWFDSHDGRLSQLDGELVEFLDEGPAPLVVSLGSYVHRAVPQLSRAVTEVALELGMRAVILAKDEPGIASPDIKCVEYAPHSLLFPHAAAIVHHGGVGTAAQALKAGKPQLAIPIFADQFDNANRLSRLGVGISSTQKQFKRAGASLIRSVLDNPEFGIRASEIARDVSREDGAKVAAEHIMRAVSAWPRTASD